MSHVKELRALTDPELRQRLDQARKDLRGLRLNASRGTIEQPHRIRQMRRDIARMLTMLGESSRSEGDQRRAECRNRRGSGLSGTTQESTTAS